MSPEVVTLRAARGAERQGQPASCTNTTRSLRSGSRDSPESTLPESANASTGKQLIQVRRRIRGGLIDLKLPRFGSVDVRAQSGAMAHGIEPVQALVIPESRRSVAGQLQALATARVIRGRREQRRESAALQASARSATPTSGGNSLSKPSASFEREVQLVAILRHRIASRRTGRPDGWRGAARCDNAGARSNQRQAAGTMPS